MNVFRPAETRRQWAAAWIFTSCERVLLTWNLGMQSWECATSWVGAQEDNDTWSIFGTTGTMKGTDKLGMRKNIQIYCISFSALHPQLHQFQCTVVRLED
ncbi:hypothetical protein BDZ94DRAFT_1242640 [Collybia nuda]|uniref:Uncharacterized protein n=1 Tax=Collybia nuda TaxID=64659 RepID=A0A9P5YIZ3_9AGAR|nr:hypothetical protein BDZ94DRAFT_1242640 [Collybia nuda]